MEISELIGLAGVPFVIAFVQVLKPIVSDARVYPLLALATGVVMNLAIAASLDGDPIRATAAGLIAGLAASGLYSQGKALAGY
jgi:hypothetical protein